MSYEGCFFSIYIGLLFKMKKKTVPRASWNPLVTLSAEKGPALAAKQQGFSN
jgi:hypothetical protein